MKPTYDFLLDKYLCHKHDSSDFTGLTANPISIAYGDLVTLQTGFLLEPGQQYEISDFATKHRVLDGNTVTTDFNTGTLEPLILTATSTNTFDKQAYSTLYPQDIIYYDITGGDSRDIAFFDGTQMPIEGLKGVIYYRKDTIQNVECWYDFRNVKFRRWLVSATPWVPEETYVNGNVYEYGELPLTSYTLVSMFNNIPPINPQQNEYYLVGSASIGDWVGFENKIVQYHNNVWIEQLLFHGMFVFNLENNKYYVENGSTVWNEYTIPYTLYKCLIDHTGVITTPDLDTTNWIKWLDKTQHWSWTSDKTQFNIGDITTDNLIMSNPIDIYTFGDYYKWVNDVHIGRIYLDYMNDNGYSTRLNNIVFNTTDNLSTCFSNTIGENCVNNTIGNNFQFNTIGNNFHSNIIGNSFYYNIIGNEFYSNTIGNEFYYNTIGNGFTSNTIGNGFTSNTIGDYFNSNIIGNYFENNIIGYTFNSNTIGNSFQHNDFKYCPQIKNLTTATHVYANYNCEIFKNSAGVLRLKYIDGTDADKIVEITD